MAEDLKPVRWVASSRKDLREFPEGVQDDVGFALYRAQQGKKHAKAKPLQGFGGAGVLEVVADDDGDTYRAVYTVRFADAVYVLHCFQKEISLGNRNAQIGRRTGKVPPKAGGAGARRMAGETEETMIEESSSNVFADLGLPNPEERLAKARLASAIADALDARGLTEPQAAARLGVDAPTVAKLLQGRLAGFPTERLLHFLLSLGLDVDIVVHRELPAEDRPGAVSIAYA